MSVVGVNVPLIDFEGAETGRNISTFDIQDLDDANESQWRAFTTELADRVANFEPGCELSIRPAYLPEGVADRAMLVRSTTTGTLVCAAFGLVDPDRPWRRSDESSIHVVEEDASWVDRFAATLVAAIRASWNLPHPSFLRGWEPIAPADSSTAITETVDESVFAKSVGEALTARFGGGVEFSDAGFLVTAGPTTTVVNVLGVDECASTRA